VFVGVWIHGGIVMLHPATGANIKAATNTAAAAATAN